MRHLSDQDLAMAVMDPAALDSASQNHLAGCARCQDELSSLERGLEGLSQSAREFAPNPPPPPRMELPQARPSWSWLWGGSLAAGAVAAALILAVTLWGPGERKITPPAQPLTVFWESQPEPQLIAFGEVDDLAEMGGFQRFLLGEEGEALMEEFWEFISPPVTEEPAESPGGGRSHNRTKESA